MIREKSYGAIIFRKEKKEYFVLLLRYKRDNNEYWDFPKGHAERDENALEAVEREVFEETGIKEIHFVEKFKESISFFFKRDGELISKVVDFYIAITSQKEVNISFEHLDYKWCTIEEANEIMKFKNSKEVLEKAYDFLQKNKIDFQKNLDEY